MKQILGYLVAVIPLYAASQTHGWITIPLILVSIWFFGYVMFSDWFNDRTPSKSLPDTLNELVTDPDLEDDGVSKIVVVCSQCSQKLRVPARKRILVTCTKCNHKFRVGT